MQGWKNAGKGLLQANLKNEGREKGDSRGIRAGKLGKGLFMGFSKGSPWAMPISLPPQAPALKRPCPREAAHG